MRPAIFGGGAARFNCPWKPSHLLAQQGAARMPNLGRRVCHARQDFAAGNVSTTASMPRPVAICRLAWARGLAAALLLAALGSVAAVQATEPLVSRALMQDATLWAIDFVDQEHGWA